VVLVRPEHLRVRPVPGANGIVTSVTFRGAQSRVEVLLWADVAVKVDVASSEASMLSVGESVEVSICSSSVLVDRPGAAAFLSEKE
jgi:hypothetical protein